MSRKNEYFVVFFFGGIIYSLIEVLTRGFTHWTMTLTGGLAFLIVYILNLRIRSESLLFRCIVGSTVITITELFAGIVINIGLDLRVWDYSDERYNILGQICPLFSFFWFMLCIPATILTILLKYKFNRLRMNQ